MSVSGIDKSKIFGSMNSDVDGMMQKEALHENTEEIMNRVQGTSNSEGSSIVLASTFTVDPIVPAIEFWMEKLEIRDTINVAPYNQVFQELLNPAGSLLANRKGMNVIFIRFDDWLRSRRKEKNESNKEILLSEDDKTYLNITIKDFLDALKTYSKNSSCPTLLLLCPSSDGYAESAEWASITESLEKKLLGGIKKLRGVEFVKAEDWHSLYKAEDYYDPVRDEMGHIPFSCEYFSLLGTIVMRRYYALKSKPPKVIVLDCDNTLWEGVCGEVGPEQVKVEGSCRVLQNFMLQQSKQGMLLCLCSKNAENDVWRVFDENKSMILSRDNIVTGMINWLPKSENLKYLAEKLNLGLDSFIFIDDSPLECAEVSANCQGVSVIRWKSESTAEEAERFLKTLWFFDHYSVTEEDSKRTSMYKDNLKREKLRESTKSFEKFLKSLNLIIETRTALEDDLPRISQLTERTNQFNFTTIKRSEKDIRQLLDSGKYECFTVKVSDRFGEYGLVGVMLILLEEEMISVDTFLLSCRVLGRGVEHRMLAKLGEIAVERNLKSVRVVFRQTPKNEPAKRFLEQVGKDWMKKTESGLEFEFPSKAIRDISYNPENQVEVQSGRKQGGAEEKEQAVLAVSGRDALLRICTELSDMEKLAAEIESYRLEKAYCGKEEAGLTASDACAVPGDEKADALYYRVMESIKQIFAKNLNLSLEQLDMDDELERWEIPSIKIVDITADIARKFKGIPVTLLFEHRSLRSIVNYIVLNHSDRPKGEDEEESVHTNTNQKKNVGSKVEDIAIIGMNGIFPGASTLQEFWSNLKEGKASIGEVKPGRWDMDKFFDPSGKNPDKSYSKWGGFIDDIDKFDAAFFNISPKEAETMDPQQRLMLQVVWGLLEDAGYTRENMDRNTGVFIGVIASDYAILTGNAALNGCSPYRNADFYQIPNRISYFYDFNGPSMAVDTACSASGTALHLACESLRRGECKTAVAGGVNLFIHPSRFIQYSRMQFMSHDGICRPFGDEAGGTVFGEGIGTVLLKPLKDAERDKDHIYAVIKGSAVNSGGKTTGFTVPNPQAQADMISRAIKAANVDARTISYVEAHGTGTPLGDPIEIRGLAVAFQNNTWMKKHKEDKQYCAIGSLKANIGHLESGAAIAGVMKVALQLENAMLVPSLNSGRLNPSINFDETPFYVRQSLGEWEPPRLEIDGETKTCLRRAGVSSFGAGGSNVHIVLEEYVSHGQNGQEVEGQQVIVLSAKSEERLRKYAARVAEFLKTETDGSRKGKISLGKIAFTLQTGREALDERLAFVATSVEQVVKVLTDFGAGLNVDGDFYRGNAKYEKTKLAKLFEGNEGREFIRIAMREGNLQRLAQLWVSGIVIDWRLLLPGEMPEKISLPGYPFEGEKYWITGQEIIRNETDSQQAHFAKLHPLIDRNISNFKMQRFSTVLTGNELFLLGRAVSGKKMLPVAAYMEMAFAAAEISAERKVRKMNGIVLSKPIILDGSACEVWISLHPGDGAVEFEISSEAKNGSRIIHSQGFLEFEENNTVEPKFIDIDLIKARCSEQKSAAKCYKTLLSNGVTYGKDFQAIAEFFSNKTEALSLLELPEPYRENFLEYTLHPALMDGALQTAFLLAGKAKSALYSPYTLGEIEIAGVLPERCYVFVSMRSSSKGEPAVKLFDIMIADETGQVLVKVRDYAVRILSSKANTIPDIDDESMLELLRRLEAGELTAVEVKRLMEE
jgi:FkbH-like protein